MVNGPKMKFFAIFPIFPLVYCDVQLPILANFTISFVLWSVGVFLRLVQSSALSLDRRPERCVAAARRRRWRRLVLLSWSAALRAEGGVLALPRFGDRYRLIFICEEVNKTLKEL